MRLERDGLTWLAYLQVAAYGYFLYGFGPTVSLLRDEQGISRTLSGLHGTALAVGALLAALVVAPLVRRFGRGRLMWGGLAALCAGIVLYTATDRLGLTLTGALLASFGGSFVVVPVAAVLAEHHRDAGASAITEANAVAAGVGTVAPLVVGAAVATGLGWRAALLVLLPVVAAMGVLGRSVRYPWPAEPPEAHLGSTRLPSRYWISWGVITAGIAVEFCMTLWTADVLRSRYDLSPAAASAGVFAVVGGMFVGRVVGGRLALRVPVDQLLYLSIGVCAVGFTAFWLTTEVAVAIVGLLVTGLGISVFYPLGVARAIDASEGRPDIATARAGLAAALASGGGPFLLGALADRTGIHGAFLVVPGLLAAAAVGTWLSRSPRTTGLAVG